MVTGKNRKLYGVFVNVPFTKFSKISSKTNKHELSDYHIQNVKKGQEFCNSIENVDSNIDKKIDKNRLKVTEMNCKIVKFSADVVLLCGHQGLPLRGDNENLSDPENGNPGNFLAILQTISHYDEDLKNHLANPKFKNAKYTFPEIQNQLIDVIGKGIIRDKIVCEIKKAKYFSVMADEVTSFNQTVMPLVVRFVDETNTVREDFLSFIYLERITGKHIADAILSCLKDLDLDIDFLRGQSYDGAANMSGAVSGAQALVRKEAPRALYVHCCAHALNLVISRSCSIVSVRNMVDKIKEVCLFFLNSPKREKTLIDVVSIDSDSARNKKPILDLCKTRWAERSVAYDQFDKNYVHIVRALERIAHNMYVGDYSSDFDNCWEGDSKSRASSILASITSFEFIIVFTMAHKLLSHLSGITLKLQGKTEDIVMAYNQVRKFML